MKSYITTSVINKRKLEFKLGEDKLRVIVGGMIEKEPTDQAMLLALLRDIEDLQKIVNIQDSKTEKMTRTKKYAVGLATLEDDIAVVIVEADSDMDALIKATAQKYGWDLTKEPEFKDVQTLDDLIDLALQGDINLSMPVLTD